jgi:phosphoribosyl 1,2-cyclic phosphodiesterase
VRYGGNTSCVSVGLADGETIMIDCGTGARNFGISLLAGVFGKGRGSATVLLSHAHWDHIQGFPFFGPFYVPGNRFTVIGGSHDSELLERVLERQMAAQFFPVQSYRNMGAQIEMRAVPQGREVQVGNAKIIAHPNPHGPTQVMAFRIEAEGRTLVYASDVGYEKDGLPEDTLAFYRGADLLIHDCTFTPEDRAQRVSRGLSSLDDAVEAAVRSGVRTLALFHYDQDYSDQDVDELVARGRRKLDDRGARSTAILGAAEGVTIKL